MNQLPLVAVACVAIACIAAAAVVALVRADGYKRKSLELEAERLALRNEITSRKVAEEQLRTAAHRDYLTGLPNRPYILNHVSAMIDDARAHVGRHFALFYIDLDRFAIINDSLGHSAGDAVLTMAAQRLCERIPVGSGFGRIGGDEFVVCSAVENIDEAVDIAERLLAEARRPLFVADREIILTASIGVVLSASRYNSAEAIFRDADIAMYAAKNAGRARFAIFDRGMHDRAMERLSLEGRLRVAIDRAEFVPYYQPIIEIRSGQVRAVEALARWNHPDGRQYDMSEVILIAEQTGLVSAVDSSILAQVCADAALIEASWPGMQFAVNVSATYLQNEDFVSKVAALFSETGVNASSFKIEVTETAMMNQPEEALRTLERLRDLGTQIVVDDFGTGHSSLSYAQRLPIAGLKIDRSFITPILQSVQSAAIVRAVVAMAKSLGLYVVAEGVENEEQLRLLEKLRVDYAQGFYFSSALSREELLEYVKRDTPLHLESQR